MQQRNSQNAFLLTALLVLSLQASAFAQHEKPLRVMSYNIHHGRGTDGTVDLERIAATILESNAELVSLQELDNKTRRTNNVDQLAVLASLTKMNYAFGKAIDFSGGEYGVGVLSKYTIEEVRRHPLPFNEGHEQRVALEVKVKLPAESLTFVATHLDHTRQPDDRIAQIRELNKLFAHRKNKKVILVGDLNSERASPELAMLLEHWRPASLKNPAPTFPSDQPKRQIDYVMLRKLDAWNVESTEVLNRPVDSDHAPLVVNLQAAVKSGDTDLDELIRLEDGNLAIHRSQEWEARRATILDAMQTIMGQLPGAERQCELDIKIEEKVDCDTYVRKLISYTSEPGSRVPAYLLIPKSAANSNVKTPAVMCLHPTDNRVGHKVVVGLGGKPNRQYAQELAERGYVTLAPAYPLLADYQPKLSELGYESGTMKAIWDNIRGIDLLESLPYVSRKGVGVIGHSLGGHNGVYTAAFDQRIKVVVSSCGLDSYQDYMNGDIRGWTSDRYMPKLLDYSHRLHQLPFDFQHILASIAPRPVFISAPKGDTNFSWQSVDRVTASARPVYKFYNASADLEVVHPDCDHDFPGDTREQAYAFIDRALRP